MKEDYKYARDGMLMRQRNAAMLALVNAEANCEALHTTNTNLRDLLVIAEGQRDMAEQERDRWKGEWVVAEEDREGWKERALKSERQRQSLRDLLIIAEGQRDQAKIDAEHWKGEWAVAMGQLGGARAEVEAVRTANASLYDLLMIAEGQRDGARAQVKEMKQRLDEWVRWGDRMASGHPDAPMASLDHEVRAVIANRYGMSTITDAMAVQPTTGEGDE